MPLYAVKGGESKVYVRKKVAVKSFKEVVQEGVQGGEPSFVWLGSFVPVPLMFWWLFGIKGVLISLVVFVLFAWIFRCRKICSRGDIHENKS